MIDWIKPILQTQGKYENINELTYKLLNFRILNSHFYTVDGDAEVSDIPYIFRISPMYYSIIGSLLVAVIGEFLTFLLFKCTA